MIQYLPNKSSFTLSLVPLEVSYQQAKRPYRPPGPPSGKVVKWGSFHTPAEYTLYVANELRRILLSDIPCLALDEVEFNTNRSSFPEEMIAHRLGMIPLPLDFVHAEKIAHLQVRGYSEVDSSHIFLEDIPITSEKFSICPLRLGEELDLTATVRLGTAQEHAKWQVVSSVGFEVVTSNKFLFELEETGSLSTPEILQLAAGILHERCNVVLYGF